MTVICVDDERNSIELLESTVKEVLPNDRVYAFTSPLEALAFAEETRCDIAFLDITMPAMNGLELGKRLKRLTPHINIIFVTGYSDFTGDALRLHASGYLTKPATVEDVRGEIENLLHPVETTTRQGIYIQTFGQFECFADGKPIHFDRTRAKEMLAYLVDRRGAGVTRKEISAILFEDVEYSRATQDYISKIFTALVRALKAVHAEHILIKGRNQYAVDTDAFTCDSYQYLDGVPSALNLFRGEYMTQYSWAEYSLAHFYE